MFKSQIIIPICAFYINLCTFGYMRSGGILYMAFKREFNCSYAQASWPTVLIGSFASFTIFVAAFLTHYFEKRLIITIGILMSSFAIGISGFVDSIQWIILLSAVQGIGIGFFVGLLPIIISEHFKEGKSVACGLSYSGSTLAAFVFPPLLQVIIEHYNLKIALLTLSLISFSALLTIQPLKSVKKINESISNDKKINFKENLFKLLVQDLKVMNLFPFWIITSIYVVFIYVFVIFVIILPDLAVDRGLDIKSAAILVSIYSIGDFAGRLIPGFIHLKSIINNQTFYLYSIIMMAMLFFCIKVYAISFLIFSILCFAIGFVTGIQMTLPAVVMVEFIGVEQTTIGFGLCNIISGLIALTRPLLIDYIKVATKNYDYLLIINGILCCLATIPWYLYLVSSSSKTATDRSEK